MKFHLRRTGPILIGAAVVVTALTVTQASGSTAPDVAYTTSGTTVEPSMVQGSSRTSLGTSSLAQTAAGEAAAADAPDVAYTTSSAVVVTYDPTTKAVLARHRYGASTAGKILAAPKPPSKGSGTGGSTTSSGCERVTVYQSGHSFLGATVWTWKVWTDWCWTRSNQVVSINGTGHDFSTDGLHKYNGTVDGGVKKYFYDFSTDNGYPKSAYHHHEIAEFEGRAVQVVVATYEYPKNTLDSYYNGTWQWFTSCSCA